MAARRSSNRVSSATGSDRSDVCGFFASLAASWRAHSISCRARRHVGRRLRRCQGIGAQLSGKGQAQNVGATASQILFVAGDPVTRLWLEGLNPVTESLAELYRPGKPRDETYREMVERILGRRIGVVGRGPYHLRLGW